MSSESIKEKLLKEKVQEHEERELLIVNEANEIIAELLDEKGYDAGDIEINRGFTVTVGDLSDTITTDFIITLRGTRYMTIKCSMAIDSRERQIVAFSRVVDTNQIPYCVISDGAVFHMFDTVTGKLISESPDGIPTRELALKELDTLKLHTLPAEKHEKESRIILAFEAAICPSKQS